MNPLASFVVSFLSRLFAGAGIASIPFFHQDWAKTLQNEEYDTGRLTGLGEELIARIQARTPVMTGALQSSEKYEVGQPGEDYLLNLYADDAEQEAAWGRVYAGYVEGEPLGLTSPTIANPAQMFFLVQTEDIDLIEAYMGDFAQSFADKITYGIGATL
jgi:hypothetical protein